MIKVIVILLNAIFIAIALHGAHVNDDIIICASCIGIAVANYIHGIMQK